MLLCISCISAADAQSLFTQRLQQSKNGEGKITVTQDKAIDELVNGLEEKEKEKRPAPAPKEKKEPKVIATETHDTITVDTPEEIQKKIMKGVKVTGYRVQVFAGGNTRNDRLKAERIGSEIKGLFPGVPVYVHFYSPRWICRMGNYRTYEEAHEVLERVKNNGFQSAIIVKGKITVQYQ